jgi:hypothetical protein
MTLFIASGGIIHQFTTKKFQIATPKKICCWFGYQKGFSFKPGRAQNGSTDEKREAGIQMPVTPAKKYWIHEKNRIAASIPSCQFLRLINSGDSRDQLRIRFWNNKFSCAFFLKTTGNIRFLIVTCFNL